MPELVVPLDAVGLSDVQRVGTKAATLGALLDAGFPVPRGFCVTSEAFRLAFEPLVDSIDKALNEHDLDQPAGVEAAAAAIAAAIAGRTAQLAIPSPLVQALDNTLSANPATLWAVRSSAPAEDRAEASFAGQYVSLLGVHGERALWEAIIACWRSFYGAHALAARAAHGAPEGEQAMAVLIQPAIEAECAGVCFSMDPVRRRRDRAVVHAAWGLGIGVVEGSVATDTAWVRRAGFRVDEHHVVEQREQIVFDLAGGVRRAPVPADRQRAACLPDPWLQRIAQYGVASEVLFGCPQDVEWAIHDGQVWVLQSRPITALPPEMSAPPFPVEWADETDRRRLWTLAELSGREWEALLPLEIEYEAVRESVRQETCAFLGADKNLEMQLHNGRIYFAPLPFPLSEGDRRIRRAAHQDLKARLWDQGRTAWDYWGPEVVQAAERLAAFHPEGADGPQLAQHLEDTLAVRRRHTMLHPMMWFDPQPPFFEAVARITGRSGQEAEEIAYGLLDGEETPHAGLVDGLYELAHLAREVPVAAELIVDPPPDAIDRLRALPAAEPFCAALDRFLERYGERNGRGWGFEPTMLTPTWRQDPSQVLALIAAYLGSDIEHPAAVRARTRRARDAQVEALCAACPDRDAAAEFRRQLERARNVMTVLDYHNHYIDQMGFGHVRHAVVAAARWLVARGALPDERDVFWLTFEEIGAALRQPAGTPLEKTIAARRAEHARWAALEAPPLLGVPDARLPLRPPPEDRAASRSLSPPGMVTGQGASPGRVSGRARVVEETVALPDLSPGDVLVARNVSPRWTPLLAVVHAMVLDEGSLGQHAAIIAREYGVPAVIRTVGGTRRIPEGAWVTVDGSAGRVEIGSAPSPGREA
jgi:phosphohistidine swiveling domain-containing protein